MPRHTLSNGDVLYDHTDASFTVTEVHDDGSVTMEIDDGKDIQRTATWAEDQIVTALEEELLRTRSGKSADLLAE